MIYFIQAQETGHIKIGFTDNNVLTRLYDLQVACPYKLNLLGVADGGKDIEKSLHLKFNRFRVRGEWFEAKQSLMAFINAKSFSAEPLLVDSIDSDKVSDFMASGFNLDEWLEFEEKRIIKEVMKETRTVTKTAQVLGISFRSMRYRLQKYALKE